MFQNVFKKYKKLTLSNIYKSRCKINNNNKIVSFFQRLLKFDMQSYLLP